jgi:hypothetical protein
VTDIRSLRGGTQTWTLVVDTERGQEVAITWPDLAAMPPNLIANLEDLQTGQVRFMRAATGYRFDSGPGGPRQFRISVSERRQGPPQIMGFSYANAAAGLRMSCTLASDASVDVLIRNIAGHVVKRLWRGREMSAGEAEIIWTGQADGGLNVPNGTYIVDIVAQSPETGERTGLVRTVRYQR